MSKYCRLILYQLEWIVGTVFCFFFNEYCQNGRKMYFRLKPFDGITWCETNKKILVYCFSVHRNDYYDCTPPFDLLRWWKIYMSYSVLFTNGKCSNSFLSTQTSIKHRYYNIFFFSVSVCATNRYCIPFTFTLKLNHFFFETNSSYTKKNCIVLLGPLNGLWEALNGKKFILLKSREKKVYFVRWFCASLHYFNKCSSECKRIRSLFLSLNELCLPRAYFRREKKTQRKRKKVGAPVFFSSLLWILAICHSLVR